MGSLFFVVGLNKFALLANQKGGLPFFYFNYFQDNPSVLRFSNV